MELDWDLHAVVRGCSSTVTSSTTTTPTASSSCSSYFQPQLSPPSSTSSSCGLSPVFDSAEEQQQQQQQGTQVLSFCSSSSSSAAASYSYPFGPRNNYHHIEELHELCKPFFTKSQPQQQQQQQPLLQASSPLSSSFSYSSVAAAPPPPPKPVQPQEKQQQQNQRSKNPHPGGGSVTTPRSKRRKNQLKRICQVPVENLSSDIWAWRKYGQKPIKGSPYPRGYYRCSSSKGCLARKQVERNKADPTMFIVTYTAEHNHPAPTHRNSLAGSTRQKPLTTPPPPQAATTATDGGGESEKALLEKPAAPVTPVAEEEAPPKGEKSSESRVEKEDLEGYDEGDEFGLSDMVLPDDFFESLDGLSQITGTTSDDAAVTGDCFGDPFSAIQMPNWVASSAATAAGGS